MSEALTMPLHALPLIGHAQFLPRTATYTYRLQGETIVLRHDPEVFPPSPFGLNFAERIDFSGCRRAADIGTGTGLLAILAARKGVADVKATDISAAALNLTDGNARTLNGIDSVDVRLGHFFGDLEGDFDLITANLPQEIIPPAYRATLSPLQAKAIDGGGPGGNAILLDFLDVAASHMHRATRLYFDPGRHRIGRLDGSACRALHRRCGHALRLWSMGYLLRLYPASTVAPFALLVPIFGLLSARLTTGERFDGLRMGGIMLMCFGLAIANLPLDRWLCHRRQLWPGRPAANGWQARSAARHPPNITCRSDQ